MSRPQKGKPDRDIMLAQAEALFADRGFGASSLRDVIGAMRCSTTAFYARFDSKDDVFEALVRGLVDDLQSEAGATLGAVRSVPEGFDAGIEVLIETLLPRQRLVALALSEGTAIDSIRDILRESYSLLAALLTAQFELVGAGEPEARAWALVGAIQMQVMRWAVFGELEDDELETAVRRVAQPLVL